MSKKIFKAPVDIRLRVEKETKDRLQKKYSNITEFINEAIREKLERERNEIMPNSRRTKMMKFRGKRHLSEDRPSESIPLEIELNTKGFGRDYRQVLTLDIVEESMEINISNHWITIPDLEAIVEKVMGRVE